MRSFYGMDTILYFRADWRTRNEKLLLGAQEIAGKSHVHIQVIDEDPTKERIRELCAFWNCKGIIFEYGNQTTAVDPRIFGKTPVVFFNSTVLEPSTRTFYIKHDSKETGKLAARELLLSGVPNYAFVPAGIPPHNGAKTARRALRTLWRSTARPQPASSGTTNPQTRRTASGS